ncbi:hypothetical protein V6N13_090112 [Hibiscus sabdariffa]
MHSNSISTKNKWQKIASIGRTDNIMAAAHQSKKQLKKLKCVKGCFLMERYDSYQNYFPVSFQFLQCQEVTSLLLFDALKISSINYYMCKSIVPTCNHAYLKNGISGELFKLPKVKQVSGRRWHPLEGKNLLQQGQGLIILWLLHTSQINHQYSKKQPKKQIDSE